MPPTCLTLQLMQSDYFHFSADVRSAYPLLRQAGVYSPPPRSCRCGQLVIRSSCGCSGERRQSRNQVLLVRGAVFRRPVTVFTEHQYDIRYVHIVGDSPRTLLCVVHAPSARCSQLFFFALIQDFVALTSIGRAGGVALWSSGTFFPQCKALYVATRARAAAAQIRLARGWRRRSFADASYERTVEVVRPTLVLLSAPFSPI